MVDKKFIKNILFFILIYIFSINLLFNNITFASQASEKTNNYKDLNNSKIKKKTESTINSNVKQQNNYTYLNNSKSTRIKSNFTNSTTTNNYTYLNNRKSTRINVNSTNSTIQKQNNYTYLNNIKNLGKKGSSQKK